VAREQLAELDKRYKAAQALPDVNGAMTPADLQAAKDVIEASYRSQIGGAPARPAAAPAAPAVAPAAAPKPSGKPALKVGDVKTVKGKAMRITKLYPDGTFDAELAK
jgi:hypothetical protein